MRGRGRGRGVRRYEYRYTSSERGRYRNLGAETGGGGETGAHLPEVWLSRADTNRFRLLSAMSKLLLFWPRSPTW
jgi:hypothetical protein